MDQDGIENVVIRQVIIADDVDQWTPGKGDEGVALIMLHGFLNPDPAPGKGEQDQEGQN